MSNTVTVNADGTILATYEGYQTYKSVSETNIHTQQCIEQLRHEHKPVRVLVDVTKVGKVHSGARKIGLQLLKALDYDRVAIFGGDIYLKHLILFLIFASNKSAQVHYFDAQEPAVRWLLES